MTAPQTLQNSPTQELIQKVKNYKSLLQQGKVDLNCPSLIFQFHEYYAMINKELRENNRISPVLLDAINLNKLINTPSSLPISEVLNKLNQIVDILNHKEFQAKQEGKKLLVALGESPYHQHSLLFEFITIALLKSHDFSSLLISTDQDKLNHFQREKLLTISNIAWFLAEKSFDMVLSPIDPLIATFQDQKNQDPDKHSKRNTAMANAIAAENSENQLCILSKEDLDHIASSPIINQNFIVIPIDISISSPTKDPSPAVSSNILKLSLAQNVESFNLNQIFTIYEQVLPNLQPNLCTAQPNAVDACSQDNPDSSITNDPLNICPLSGMQDKFLQLVGIIDKAISQGPIQ